MKETNELDTYIKLKYGYPLTSESYRQMPDELLIFLYYKLFFNDDIKLVIDAHWIRFTIQNMFSFSFQLVETLTSEKAWDKIKEYHRDNLPHT